MEQKKEISLELRGNGKVEVLLDCLDGEVVAEAENTGEMMEYSFQQS